MKSVLRNITVPPKKLNVVAGLVRGMKVSEALPLLRFMNKKAALPIYDAIKSAASNAVHNGDADEGALVIDSIFVNKGMMLKRYRPGSRGQAQRYAHVRSHLFVNLK